MTRNFLREWRNFADTMRGDDPETLAAILDRTEQSVFSGRTDRYVLVENMYRRFMEGGFRESLNAELRELLGDEGFDCVESARKRWQQSEEKRFLRTRGELNPDVFMDEIGMKIVLSERGRDLAYAESIFLRLQDVLRMEFLRETVRSEEAGEGGSVFAHFLEALSRRAGELARAQRSA